MKSKALLIITTAMSLSILSLISCKKETSVKNNDPDQELMTMSEEHVKADAGFDDLTEIALAAGADLETADLSNEQAITNPTATSMGLSMDLFPELRYKTGPCTSLEVTPFGSTFPKTITVNFGDGCVCKDGKFRKGSTVMLFTAPIRKNRAKVTISLVEYYVNNTHVEGSKTITNLTSNNVTKYTIKVENGKLSFPNGRGFSYNAERTITQTEGIGSWTLRDDAFSIEGNASTVYSNGFSVVKSTESPVTRRVGCGRFVAGNVKIVINNNRNFYIDFGSGECDNKAILSWANREKEITLH